MTNDRVLHQVTLDSMGAVYRIITWNGRFVVEAAPLHDDGSIDESEFGELGGSPGSPSGTFTTETGARGFLQMLATLPGGADYDEDAFWRLLSEWEGH